MMLIIIINLLYFIIISILSFILLLFARINILRLFNPKMNYDKYFLNYAFDHRTYGFIVIDIKCNEYNFDNIHKFTVQQLKQYLKKKKNIIKLLDFEKKNIIEYKVEDINEIIQINNQTNCDENKFLNNDKSIQLFIDKNQKKISLKLSHVFYSGLSIINNLICNNNNCTNQINLSEKPTYYPFITEFIFFIFLLRNLYFVYRNNISIPKIPYDIQKKNTRLKSENVILDSLDLKKISKIKKNFNTTLTYKEKMSYVIFPLSKAIYSLWNSLSDQLKKSKLYFNVSLLVGFNEDNDLINNFSFILLNIETEYIPKPTNNKINQEQLNKFIIYVHNQVKMRKKDIISTFQLLNSFNFLLNSSTSNENSSMIDCNFSCLPSITCSELNNYDPVLNNQIYLEVIDCSQPLYCCSKTINNISNNCFSINTLDCDIEKFKCLNHNFYHDFY